MPAATHIIKVPVTALAPLLLLSVPEDKKIDGADAKNFWRSLEKAGFSKVYGTPIEGDVAVIDALPGAHQNGHACIYDGSGTWYSDFKQNSLYPGPTYRKIQPKITLYRHY